jgi:hypothetical protein
VIKPVVEKYRRSTGRLGTPNTGKVIEIAKEKTNCKKQGAEQWKQAEIQARAGASPGQIDVPQKQSPAAERRRAHTSKTRISAIAHPLAERTLKGALVIPAGLSKIACSTRSYAMALP